MAEVFAGFAVGDHGFQKPVAIKRLLPELANDEVFVDRLIEEAKLLVGMQHGQIVSVLDLARENDDVFLVMEYVDGPSLRQLIKSRGQRGLSLGVATHIVMAAAAGLEFAHSRAGGAIIHADISPSNILLTTSGEVRVADFGIARREGLGQGVVEGKWAYMAPEQARGESLTPRSDVFALGVVLYELLTGQHPFGRAVSASQRDEQMRVIPPRVVKPSVPAGLDAICMRALAHDPRDRYPRMQPLIDALVEERFANGYREGASDLAQAIREGAPKSDAAAAAPRTMHTERPITLMTRSLLKDITPPGRPSHRPAARPSQAPGAPLGPSDPPPRDAFPMRRTRGVQAVERPESFEPAARLGSQPELQGHSVSHGSQPRGARGSAPVVAPQRSSSASVSAPPRDAFADPSSSEQTGAREVDQAALAAAQAAAQAQAAQIAAMQAQAAQAVQAAQLVQAAKMAAATLAAKQAMLQIPGARADGTPIPPFRMGMVARPSSYELGDELASVHGGGNTMTGQGIGTAASVTEEDRGHRWTIAILAAAAFAGVIAAVAFQLRSDHNRIDHRTEKALIQQMLKPPADPPTATPDQPGQPGDDKAAAGDDHQVTLPPTIAQDPDSPAPAAAAQDPNAPAPAPAAAAQDPNAPAPAPAAAAQDPNAAAGAAAAPAAGATAPAPAAAAQDPNAAAAAAGAPANPAAPTEAIPTVVDATPSPAPVALVAAPVDAASGKKLSIAPVAAGHHKSESGTLIVESAPWSWVTVGNNTKETPDRFRLQPGTYLVQFHNQENGLMKTEHVTIEAGKVKKLNERMDH